MRIQRIETTIIERCPEGVKFADNFEEMTRKYGTFRGREDSTVNITIHTESICEIKEDEDEEQTVRDRKGRDESD